MNIIKHRKIWYAISGLLVVASMLSIFFFGLNLGIDFTGGSLLEIEYNLPAGGGRPENSVIKEKISSLNLGNVSLTMDCLSAQKIYLKKSIKRF